MPWFERSAAQHLRQSLPFHIFHREVAAALFLAHFVNQHERGMLQFGSRRSLDLESLQLGCAGQFAGIQHFQSDGTRKVLLSRFPDGSRSTLPEKLYRLELREARLIWRSVALSCFGISHG